MGPEGGGLTGGGGLLLALQPCCDDYTVLRLHISTVSTLVFIHQQIVGLVSCFVLVERLDSSTATWPLHDEKYIYYRFIQFARRAVGSDVQIIQAL